MCQDGEDKPVVHEAGWLLVMTGWQVVTDWQQWAVGSGQGSPLGQTESRGGKVNVRVIFEMHNFGQNKLFGYYNWKYCFEQYYPT